MTITELENRVAAAEEKVAKCQKTIERHKAQMEKKANQLQALGIDPESADKYVYSGNTQADREIYWLLCDYDSKKSDIKVAESKLKGAQRICAGWKEKLDLQINTEKVIAQEVPQIIKDFLQNWKDKTFQWYVYAHETFLKRKAELRTEVREAKIEALKTLPEYADLRQRAGERLFTDDYYLLNPWPRKPMEEFLKERQLDDKSVREILSCICDATVLKMCNYRKEDERLAWLDKHLESEKQAKLFWFYTAVTKITGPITDAKNLYMSAGDLNGVVLGEKGAAKVQTFSAGGWNIQRYHFRTRIDDVTQKHMAKPKLDDIIRSCENARQENSGQGSRDSAYDKGR